MLKKSQALLNVCAAIANLNGQGVTAETTAIKITGSVMKAGITHGKCSRTRFC